MKLGKIVLTAGVAAAATVGAMVVSGSASAAAKPTTRTVVRPVTASGHAAHGYRVVKDKSDPIVCGSRSPIAVDDHIAWCGSSADYALACWKQAGHHRVLCLTDPYSKTLRSIRLDGKFGHWSAPKHPRAAGLTLHSGNRYLIRGGGAWARVKQHPSWVGYYFQRSTGRHAVYGPKGGDGINQSHARWTVQVYGSVSTPGTKRLVDRAYYFGTKG